jgi:hypothetical protein
MARSHERGGKARLAAGKDRIEIDGLLKELFSNCAIRRVALGEMRQAALISLPSVEVGRRLAQSALLLGTCNCRGNRDRHRLGNFVLHDKGLGEIAVIALGSDVLAGFGLDKLRGDADAVASFAQTAFEDVAYTEFASDRLYVYGTALVGEEELRAITNKEG